MQSPILWRALELGPTERSSSVVEEVEEQLNVRHQCILAKSKIKGHRLPQGELWTEGEKESHHGRGQLLEFPTFEIFQYLAGRGPQWPALTWGLTLLWIGVGPDDPKLLSNLCYSMVHETHAGPDFFCCSLQDCFASPCTHCCRPWHPASLQPSSALHLSSLPSRCHNVQGVKLYLKCFSQVLTKI